MDSLKEDGGAAEWGKLDDPYRTIEIVAGGLCGLYSANSARRLTIARQPNAATGLAA